MIFKKLKEQLVQRKFGKELQLNPQVITQSTDKIRSVGIITTDEFLSISDFVKKLDDTIENVKELHIYNYREFNKSEEKSNSHFTGRDINWQGKIKNIKLKKFLDTPFDLLVGYFDKKHLYMEFATLKSKAAFKVGFAGVNNNLFDLVIAEKLENSSSFTKEIYTYLELLNKI